MNYGMFRFHRPFVRGFLTTLASALLVAGCGGGFEEGDDAAVDEELPTLDEELSGVEEGPSTEALPPLVSPPPSNIVGGTPTSDGGRPFQVLLLTNNDIPVCGGSFISPRTVLTAAHCVVGRSASQIKVRYGTLLASSGLTLQVSQIHQHASYNGTTHDYDVATLHLASAMVPGPNAAVIPMVAAGSDPSSGEAIVSGWGDTRGTGPAWEYLQQATIPLLPRLECSLRWVLQPITARMICAFPTTYPRTQNACHGDSGGPLTQDGKLVGVVSWGASNCSPNYPNVYANVGALRTWIDSNTL